MNIKLGFVLAFCLLVLSLNTGCSRLSPIYKALKYPCPSRPVPKPAILNKEPATLNELKAQNEVRKLYGDTWIDAFNDCREDENSEKR